MKKEQTYSVFVKEKFLITKKAKGLRQTILQAKEFIKEMDFNKINSDQNEWVEINIVDNTTGLSVYEERKENIRLSHS